MYIVEAQQNEPTQPGLWFLGSPQERADFTECLLPVALGAAAAGRFQLKDVDDLAYNICRGSALHSVPGTLKAPLFRMLDAAVLPSTLNARRRGILKEGVANRAMSAAVQSEITLLNRAEHLTDRIFWINSEGFVARPNQPDKNKLTVATFARGTGPWEDFDDRELALANNIGATHCAEKHRLTFSPDPLLPPQLEQTASVWALGAGEGNSFRQLPGQ